MHIFICCRLYASAVTFFNVMLNTWKIQIFANSFYQIIPNVKLSHFKCSSRFKRFVMAELVDEYGKFVPFSFVGH